MKCHTALPCVLRSTTVLEKFSCTRKVQHEYCILEKFSLYYRDILQGLTVAINWRMPLPPGIRNIVCLNCAPHHIVAYSFLFSYRISKPSHLSTEAWRAPWSFCHMLMLDWQCFWCYPPIQTWKSKAWIINKFCRPYTSLEFWPIPEYVHTASHQTTSEHLEQHKRSKGLDFFVFGLCRSNPIAASWSMLKSTWCILATLVQPPVPRQHPHNSLCTS